MHLNVRLGSLTNKANFMLSILDHLCGYNLSSLLMSGHDIDHVTSGVRFLYMKPQGSIAVTGLKTGMSDNYPLG